MLLQCLNSRSDRHAQCDQCRSQRALGSAGRSVLPIACLPASMMSSLEQARGGQSVRQGQHHPAGLQHAVGQWQASKRRGGHLPCRRLPSKPGCMSRSSRWAQLWTPCNASTPKCKARWLANREVPYLSTGLPALLASCFMQDGHHPSNSPSMAARSYVPPSAAHTGFCIGSCVMGHTTSSASWPGSSASNCR